MGLNVQALVDAQTRSAISLSGMKPTKPAIPPEPKPIAYSISGLVAESADAKEVKFSKERYRKSCVDFLVMSDEEFEKEYARYLMVQQKVEYYRAKAEVKPIKKPEYKVIQYNAKEL